MTTNRIRRGIALGVVIMAIAALTGVTSANATTAAPTTEHTDLGCLSS